MTDASIVYDDSAVREGLARLGRAAARPEAALKNIALHLAQSTAERVRQERAPDGSSWPALSPDYKAAKRGPGMLREMGMAGGMIASLSGQLRGGSSLEFGTNRIQARILHFGGVIRPKRASHLVFQLGGKTVVANQVTIPARPWLGVSADDREEILAIVEHFLAREAESRQEPPGGRLA